jgi:penicillin-binding protein 1A
MLFLGGVLMMALVVLIYGFWASSFDIAKVKEMPQRSTVFDMDAKLYSRLQGENRIVVRREDVSPNFVDALLTREDSRFFSHRGVDPIGVVRALVRNLAAKSARQGASTLTQQLARNTFSLGGKNLHRKLLEAFVAARIEQYYEKEEILEHYMNRIYFGAGVYGIETAAQAYFGKPARELSLGEGALLAGIIRAPTTYSPRRNVKGALAQRDQVLERLVAVGKITPQQAEAARKTPITLSRQPRLMLQENYAMEAVREDLETLLSDEQKARGGYKIYTTIDPELQRRAEKAIEEQLRKVEQRPGYVHPPRAKFASLPEEDRARTPYLQGAVVVLDNRTGGLRAIVGGRDYGESQFNRARQSRRQVGSTFKPFVFEAAYRQGLLPGMWIEDGPIRPGEVKTAPEWQPGNADGQNRGRLAAEDGLILSRNTVSVRVGERAGLDAVVQAGTSAGIDQLPSRAGIYLGAFEATLIDMATAYSVLANRGVRRQAYIIERIDDENGDTIYQSSRLAPQVLDPGSCWLVTSALMKAIERGTGTGVRQAGFRLPCAGKTGTTNDYMDAWFIGYTSTLTAAVWVGLDQPKTIVDRGYGSSLAMPLWTAVMASASVARYPARPFVPPKGQRCVVCAVSNGLATESCERLGASYTLELPMDLMPRAACTQHRGSPITRRAEAAPKPSSSSVLRSFRQFFGGDR